MKKLLLYVIVSMAVLPAVWADSVFDSNTQPPKEVKLAPAANSTITPSYAGVTTVQKATTTKTGSIKEQKFNEALVSLDDAQVELRQELSIATSKYSEALKEKARVIQNCKALKSEIKDINKKMKNVDKSKQMINRNLETVN